MAQVLADAAERRPEKMIRVWDVFVRLFHWSVAVGFFVAYFSEDALTLHVWAGYVVGAMVVLRIVWGFIGPEHARFRASFTRRARCSATFGNCSSEAQGAISAIVRAAARWCCSS
jgi:cytochrome b